MIASSDPAEHPLIYDPTTRRYDEHAYEHLAEDLASRKRPDLTRSTSSSRSPNVGARDGRAA